MNTHIIIPIKDIEDEISRLQNLAEVVKGNQLEFYKLNEKVILYGELLSIYKQISLDEKDIDIANEAEKYLPEYSTVGFAHKHFIEGYKQALKNLL